MLPTLFFALLFVHILRGSLRFVVGEMEERAEAGLEVVEARKVGSSTAIWELRSCYLHLNFTINILGGTYKFFAQCSVGFDSSNSKGRYPILALPCNIGFPNGGLFHYKEGLTHQLNEWRGFNYHYKPLDSVQIEWKRHDKVGNIQLAPKKIKFEDCGGEEALGANLDPEESAHLLAAYCGQAIFVQIDLCHALGTARTESLGFA
ncbi:MKI67 FHA domain-interacting nucleolar phosphoprotein [Spatholobus suberectus]|nr:MKI67 FHA domain-interacting nucleolar phosphoprotein [Spatholobus suberectus]